MEWILPCDPNTYDIYDAISELESIDWFTKYHINKGDICYIYVSHTEKAILYRCIAVSDAKEETTIDDEKYGGCPAGTHKRCIALSLQHTYEGPGISLYELRENGLNGSVQGQMRVEGKLAQYIHEWERVEKEEYSDVPFTKDNERIGYDVVRQVESRVGQNFFRNKLFEISDRCCICGIKDKRLLTASHIKPWAKASGTERMDRNNGFLMCPNHDKLFDSGLISFRDDGKIMISSSLSSEDIKKMGISKDTKIEHLSDKVTKYLKYHREQIFKP